MVEPDSPVSAVVGRSQPGVHPGRPSVSIAPSRSSAVSWGVSIPTARAGPPISPKAAASRSARPFPRGGSSSNPSGSHCPGGPSRTISRRVAPAPATASSVQTRHASASSAAWSGVSGGHSRVLTVPGRGAFAITTTAVTAGILDLRGVPPAPPHHGGSASHGGRPRPRTARGCPHRPVPDAEAAAGEVALRRVRIAAVRADHSAGRVLPDPARAPILEARSGEIAAASGADTLIEIGAGFSEKSRILLRGLAGAGTLRRFVPFDVSEPTLREAAERVLREHPEIEVHAIVGDFERQLELLPAGDRRLIAFLGSTVGNLDRDAAGSPADGRRRRHGCRRQVPAGRRPGQGHRAAPARVRRWAGTERGVQPPRAHAPEHRAGR